MPSRTEPWPHERHDAEAVMQKYWGYPHFRSGQADIVDAVLEGRDLLGILPTGGGKSLCYQVPSLLTDGLTIVVSPLIALMQDQVAGLKGRGIEADYINSALSYRAIDQRWTDAEHGRYRLLYVAPERFDSDMFMARAHRLDVRLLAIDEAHCVSEWGHHFRPAYLRIPEARERMGDPQTIAVTATATPPVRRDVIKHLKLHDPALIVRGFDRPNIVWSVFQTEHKQAKVREVLTAVEGSGIVYAATRRGVEEWAAWMEKEGVSASYYHGGLAPDRRETVQNDWIEGRTRVIAATNAFGMGIDKPDVRFVIHADLSSSIEAYYQEAGRGGRDGERAYAVLLFHAPDAGTQKALIDASHPSAAEMQEVYTAVCNVGQVPLGSEPEEPVVVNMDVITKVTGLPQAKVRTAIDLLEREEAWEVLPQRKHFGLVRFTQSADRVRAYARRMENRALARFVQELLRAVHADAFSEWWPLDLRLVERRTDLKRGRLLRGLQFLAGRDLLEWRPPGRALQLTLSYPRARKVPLDARAVQAARDRAEERLDDMLRYAQSSVCRRHYLLTFFGEASPERCGTCDVCMGRHRAKAITPDDEPLLRRILDHVKQAQPRGEWLNGDEVSVHRMEALLQWLVAKDYVEVDDPLAGTYTLTERARRFLNR